MKKHRLLPLLFSQRKTAAAVILAASAASAAAVVSPFLSGYAIDFIKDDGSSDLAVLFRLLAALGAVFLIMSLSQWLLSVFTVRLSNRTARQLRNEAFEKLQKLPLSFFDTKPHGEILARMTNDVDTLTDGLLQGTSQLISGSLTLTGSLIFMLFLNPSVTLIIVILTPVSILIAALIAGNSRRHFKKQAAETGRLNALSEEIISGLSTVRQFGRQQEIFHRFEDINQRLYFCGRDAQFYSSLTNPTTRLVNNIAYAAVGIAGGLLALKGSLTVGAIAGFLTYSIQFAKPINEMTAVLYQLQAAGAAADRIFELIETPKEADDIPEAAAPECVKGAVTADSVCFSYSSDRKLIENLSFSIQPGQTVAIVGPTGAGKTTLINLLMRFYEVDSGVLSLDGYPLQTLSRSALRSSFAMVLQETWLFKGTIRENIAYGKPQASEEEIRRAAVLANADPFIRCLPNGYDTVIDEGGSNLSQGQRQILTIARAMLKPAPLLILDEATSNVDTRTELKIQEAFLHLMKEKTCFVIAHRLSTIRGADQIFVMDQGNVTEQGTHEELMARNGLYARLYRS